MPSKSSKSHTIKTCTVLFWILFALAKSWCVRAQPPPNGTRLKNIAPPGQLSVGWLVANDAEPYDDLYALINWTVADLKTRRGVLSGYNISVVPMIGDGTDPALITELFGHASDTDLFGIIAVSQCSDVGDQQILDNIAVLSATLGFATCTWDNLPERLQPRMFQIIPGTERRALTLLQFLRSQGWKHLLVLSQMPIPNEEIGNDLLRNAINYGIEADDYHFDVLATNITDSYVKMLRDIYDSGVLVSYFYGRGEEFLQCLRVEKALGYTKMAQRTLWIVGDVIVGYIQSTALSREDLELLDGVIGIQSHVHDSNDYQYLKSQMSVNPKLQSYFRNATGLPAMSLYTVACTEALLQGLNKYVTDRQLSPANTETWISNIRSSPSFRIEDMMVANPPFSLVTGDAEFVNRTFNSELQFSYFYNGTFVEFAIARPNGTLQQFRGIIYADGLTNPPKDMRISTSSPAALNQIVTIAVLVVVCAIFISIVITLCILFRRKRRVQPPAPFLEKSFKLHIDSPAKRATDILMQRRNSVEAPRKKTPFTLNLSLQRDKGKVFLTSEEVEVILDALTASSDRQFLPEFANTQHGADGAGLESVIDDETRAFVLGTVMATKVRASGPQSATNASTMAVFNSGRLNGANQQQQQQHPQTAHSAPSKLQRQSDGSMVDATSSLGKEGGPSGSVHSAPRDSGTPSLNIHFATTSRANVMKSSQVQNSEDKLGNRTVDSNLSGRSVSAPSQGQMLFGSTETQSRQTPDRVEQSITTKEISASDLTRIAECLEGGFNTWNFDMFVFTEITDGHPLYYSGLYLMQSKDILNRFRIDLDTYKRWLLMMEAEYHNHPYHNAIHAADVLHALHYLLIEDPLSESFTPIECFGGIIAAIGHDIDHPGLNNNFLVKARDPLAVLYSDISVNEYHHAAHVFLTTLKSKNNIFANLTSEEYEEIRRVIIRLILCTDMGKHFEYLTKFKTKLGSNSLIGRLETQENRLVIMEIAIKCADLSNPTKTPELARKWTSAIMEEFYRQGDRERDLGLPVSQFMDRHNTSVSKCQIGFIDILVAPLYEAWVQFNSNNEKCTRLQRAINKNRSQWAGSASNSQHQLTINRESGVSSAGKMSSPGSTQHSSGNLVLNRLVNANRSVQSVIRGPATIPQHPSASGPVPITQAGANSSSRSLGFGKQKSGSAKDSPRNSFIGSSHSSLKRSGNLGTSGRFHTGDREDRVEQNDLKS